MKRNEGGEEGREREHAEKGERAVTNKCIHVYTHCVHSEALVDLLWVSGQAVLGQCNHVAFTEETVAFIVNEYIFTQSPKSQKTT